MNSFMCFIYIMINKFGNLHSFLAPTGAQGVKMCVRACVRPCDIMLTSTLEEFLRVLKSLK